MIVIPYAQFRDYIESSFFRVCIDLFFSSTFHIQRPRMDLSISMYTVRQSSSQGKLHFWLFRLSFLIYGLYIYLSQGETAQRKQSKKNIYIIAGSVAGGIL